MFHMTAVAVTVLAGLAAADVARAEEPDGPALLETWCGACHDRVGGGLTRIAHQRKTPEGWLMTIVRMGIMHGVEVAPADRRVLVKYLSDTQGLAPEEAAPYRYILERQPSVVESFPDDYTQMCGRCHSGARGALQRRTRDEWLLHIHFHLGQWPTTEYQFLGRDREWFEIATTATTDWLAEQFPLGSSAWTAWRTRPAPNLAGEWRIIARGPGLGFRHGIATLSATGSDSYATNTRMVLAAGRAQVAAGNAILYTGYEFRQRLNLPTGGQNLEIGAVSADGNTITGRSMRADADEIGVDFRAVRVRDGHAEVMAVEPPYIKAGTKRTISIHGTGLAGRVDLGGGIKVVDVVAVSDSTVTVIAQAAADARAGARPVGVGGAIAERMLTVYAGVDSVRVEPAFAIARVGGGGGSRARQQAMFDAVAYANGADDEPGTDDDLRIGAMPAVWEVQPFDEAAAALDDVKYAGRVDAATGAFTPAVAGLNPERPFSTNNAGNLKIVGTIDDDGAKHSGEGQLVVTVQRWNDPPIR
jgi:quinohemoprotein amine dehydrogenase